MTARKQENFYRRDPMKALEGMAGLSMDEKATYNVILDLLYVRWKPLRDHDKADRQFIANWVGCAPQKLNPIIARLIEKGRVVRVQIDGKYYLTDEAFEVECAKVKGTKVREKSAEVEQKSEEVAENSGEVEKKSPLLDRESEQNHNVAALDKIREDKTRKEVSLSRARALFSEIVKEAGEAMADPSRASGISTQTVLLALLDGTDDSPACTEAEILDGVRSAAAWYLDKHGPRSMRNWDLARTRALEVRDARLRPRPVNDQHPPPSKTGPKPGHQLTTQERQAAIREGLTRGRNH